MNIDNCIEKDIFVHNLCYKEDTFVYAWYSKRLIYIGLYKFFKYLQQDIAGSYEI